MTTNQSRTGISFARRHDASINPQTVGELSANVGEGGGAGKERRLIWYVGIK